MDSDRARELLGRERKRIEQTEHEQKTAAADRRAALYGTDAMCLNASKDPTSGIPPSLAPRYKCTIATLGPRGFGPPPSSATE